MKKVYIYGSPYLASMMPQLYFYTKNKFAINNLSQMRELYTQAYLELNYTNTRVKNAKSNEFDSYKAFDQNVDYLKDQNVDQIIKDKETFEESLLPQDENTPTWLDLTGENLKSEFDDHTILPFNPKYFFNRYELTRNNDVQCIALSNYYIRSKGKIKNVSYKPIQGIKIAHNVNNLQYGLCQILNEERWYEITLSDSNDVLQVKKMKSNKNIIWYK